MHRCQGAQGQVPCQNPVTATCIVCEFYMCSRHTVNEMYLLHERVNHNGRMKNVVGWICEDCKEYARTHPDKLRPCTPDSIRHELKRFTLDEAINLMRNFDRIMEDLTPCPKLETKPGSRTATGISQLKYSKKSTS